MLHFSWLFFQNFIHYAFEYNTFSMTEMIEWGWTAQNLIARQSFAQHFWQQINRSTQNLSTAQIQLILAQLDSSSWQKKWQMVDTVEQLTLLSSATYKQK